MTHRHVKELHWSCACAELYARNVVGLPEDKVAEVVKEAANRYRIDEDVWFALQDAMMFADNVEV